MRRLAGWIGLLSLSGLALLTASINIRATQRNYDLGRALREQDDLTDLISFRRACGRDLINTRKLDLARQRLHLDDERLYTEPFPLPAPDPALHNQPLALGVP